MNHDIQAYLERRVRGSINSTFTCLSMSVRRDMRKMFNADASVTVQWSKEHTSDVIQLSVVVGDDTYVAYHDINLRGDANE